VRAKGERSLSLLAAPRGARDEAVIAINLDASTLGSVLGDRRSPHETGSKWIKPP